MEKETKLRVDVPQLLLPFLLEKLQNKGRNKVKSLLTRGQVMVEGKIVTKHDFPLQANQEVRILGAVGPQGKVQDGIRFVYEDDYLIVVDKPPGLLSIATETEKERTVYHILTDYVKTSKRGKGLFVVHRLDRETSGLMMFAKQEEVKRKLQDEWQEAVIDRAYAVVVHGRVSELKGTIETWLKESNTKTMYVSREGDGMKAITHYEVLQANRDFSLLDVHLDTGRKNQIRVHMQSIGHPVIGDKRYGSPRDPLKRLGLHARLLSFRHPVTNEVLTFETPIPGAFRRLFTNSKSTAGKR